MAREHLFEAKLTWTGAAAGSTSSYQAYSRQFQVEMQGKSSITGSAAVPFLGDASLHNPEDLLLASVTACHLLSYLALAARRGIQVLEYEDRATATMAFKNGKMQIVEATLRPRVKVAPGTDIELAENLHAEANAECFIANSVKFPISHYFEVLEAR